MKVLGLDPSLTNFGWAIHDTEADPLTRDCCVARGRFQTSAKTLYVARYMEMRASLLALLKEYEPDRVSCEYPVFNDLWSEGMYGLFLFTSEALYLAKKDVVFFSPGQLKAHARHFLERPKGWKMLKGDMVDAARTHTGGGRWNHNEADAYWAAVSGSRFWMLLDEDLELENLSPVERQQFTKIHTYIRGKKAGKTVKSGILYREDERFHLWSKENS